MKQLLKGLWLAVGLSTTALAQPDTYPGLGKLAFAVYVPDTMVGLTDSHLGMLSTKLFALLSTHDISARSIEDAIVVWPILRLYDTREIQPGLQKLTVIDGELSFFVTQTGTKAVFASVTKKVQGSGRSREQALNNIIQSIKTDDPAFETFIKKARDKAIAYYAQRCGAIMAQAEQLSATGKDEEAMALIMSIPAEVPCFEEAKKKVLSLYLRYQTRRCKEALLAAKTKFGNNDYREGFDALATVDPMSPCYAEATQLIEKPAKEIDANLLREWDLLKTIYKNSFELEKYRYQAIAKVAGAYLANQPRRVEYDVQVR